MDNTLKLLKGLNPEQRTVVTLPEGAALILAGAGSGKTRVLTSRVAWLLATGQATPMSVLAVTFTNKAAREMLNRLEVMTPYQTRGMWVGTFHGLCNRLLRAHHRDAGLPAQFQIMDTADQLALIKRLYRAHNINDEEYPHRAFQYFVQNAKERGERPNAVTPDNDYERKMVEYYALYEDACQREGVVDFGELLLRCVELLTQNAALRNHYRERFSHLFVDEFQDTNKLQYRWLQLLTGDKTSVFAVGDDDQSIYAFRGANVGNMQRFEHDFARPDRPVHIVKLEQNYRSHGNILTAANALIQNNFSRLGKKLWTEAPEGEPLRAYGAEDEDDEARFVVAMVSSVRDQGVPLADIAVLYRSNAQSRALEHACFTAGIPYRVYGGLRFFERAEVKNALAYLRLMASTGDEGALLRVINFPVRGIGARTLELVNDVARQNNISLWTALHDAPLSGKGGANVAAFVQLIERLQEETRDLPLPELVEHVLTHSGLMAHYQNEREAEDRLANLTELVEAARRFVEEEPNSVEGEEPQPPLVAFLTHAALEAGDMQADAQQSALQLMTMHAAKGLEFHTVFITGMEQGLFPHDNSLKENYGKGVEEERRLMYVALTRAREQLYLTFAQTRRLNGQFRYNSPSQFLRELPVALIQWLSAPPAERQEAEGGYSRSGKTYYREDSGERSPGARRSYASSRATPRVNSPQPLPSIHKSAAGYRVGQNVRHAKFGVGVVVDAEGGGSDAKIQVNFQDYGQKWLSLAYTTLEKV